MEPVEPVSDGEDIIPTENFLSSVKRFDRVDRPRRSPLYHP